MLIKTEPLLHNDSKGQGIQSHYFNKREGKMNKQTKKDEKYNLAKNKQEYS